MDGGGDKETEMDNDFYGVLGLKKECTEVELRSAYKKLAMRWHPDRWSASGNAKSVEEAKKKFQDVQEAYSVLSDWNKRFLYDAGVYDKEDDDENVQGMGEFLNEMAAMMKQNQPDSYSNTSNSNNRRNSADVNFGPSGFDPYFQNFCFEVGGRSPQLDDRSKRRHSRQTRQ